MSPGERDGARPSARRGSDDELEPFRRWRATGATELRNQLVVEHLDLANALARRFSGRGEPLDDLEQVARVGLVQAVERFDPDAGVPFVGFAVPTITGELKRHFRDRTWAVHVPRRVKDLTAAVREAVDDLSARSDRVTAPQVAESLGLEVDVVLEAMEALAGYRLEPLDHSRSGEPATRRPGAVDPAEAQIIDRAALRDLLAGLPPRDRRIVVLVCYAEWTQERVAAEVGVSQMTVSRIVRRSLSTLADRSDPMSD